MAALTSWTVEGVPAAPDAWLYSVAHNELVGALRTDSRHHRLLTSVEWESSGLEDLAPQVDNELLRMLFVCCDDSIPADSRLVLALKTLCGFTSREISLRLFTTEANVNKRLGRARDHMRKMPLDLYSRPIELLASRLPSVHQVLYLLFNEGYLSAQPDRAIRRELCDEAIRLATLLVEHPLGATPETFALLALMHLHAARLAARVDETGGLLVLEEQDRSLWDFDHIRIGAALLQKSASGTTFTRFHAEAAIAAEHVLAPSFAETRWDEIAHLYELLEEIAPSPLHTMNRAVVIAELDGPEAALAVLQGAESPPWLNHYYLWDSVCGELHRRAGHVEEARRCLVRAIASAPTEPERALLRRRLASLDSSPPM
jgi:RNA polymerase sigma-70 factor (ECF subfamily)